MRPLLLLPLLLIGCFRPSPQGNPEFSDAVRYTWLSYEADEATLAYALRSLETALYTSINLEEGGLLDRSVEVERLSAEDVQMVPHPDADPSLALPVGVGAVSPWGIEDQKHIQMLVDQTPVEPSSPDHYVRTFLSGDECWLERGCEEMITTNDIVKKNTFMEVPYILLKDFRWVDMGLPDPADVPEGEEAVNEGEPRWAWVARSWTDESNPGVGGDTEVTQSYVIDVWIPRDGRGYVRQSTDENDDDGEWTTDSTGGGTLRMMAMWVEVNFWAMEVTDDQVAGLTRKGIDDNFEAADEWLDERAQD